MVEGIFPASPLPATAVRDRALILPKGIFTRKACREFTLTSPRLLTACNYVWEAPIANLNELNSCITYYVHIGPATSRRTRVTSALLTQILSEPAFNILRTQEQLGYIVSCGTWTLPGAGHLGIRIVVQSERGPNYLEERIDKFLEGMEGMIREMDERAFEEQKDGLERKWREKYKNLSEETTSYWTQVESGYLDFYRGGSLFFAPNAIFMGADFLSGEQDADFLATLTQQDVLDLFMSAVHPASPNRAKLSVHMQSQKPRPKKIGHAAAQAFEAIVKTSGVLAPDSSGGWQDEQDEQDGEPTVDEYVAHWKGLLEQQAKAAELLAAIPALVEKYPAEGEGGADRRREGAAYIEDVDAFKKGLQVSADPKPLVEWGDLPTAKF
jgi:insulysin